MGMTDIKDYLKFVQKARGNRKPKGWEYTCIEDFILKNGRKMKIEPLPEGIKRGEPRQCFKNAFLLALENGFTYCEGYANSVVPLPLMHAWCVDKNGIVIDPTWEDGKDYFGVEIPMEIANRIILKSGHYGVIDTWDLKFPFLSGEETLRENKNEADM